MDSTIIGERLTRLRGEKAPEEVALAIGVSVSTLYRIETGRQRPTDPQKVAFSNYYGKGIEELFFNDECPL